MSLNVSLPSVSKASRQKRCAWNGEGNGSCPTNAVADFMIQISDGPDDIYGVTEIPLCLEHARDKAFLTWLTRLTHDIVLKTVKTLRHQSLGDIRFTYKLVAREPRIDALTIGLSGAEIQPPGAPPVRLPGEIAVAASSPNPPYTKTYAVPHSPRGGAQAKYIRVVRMARQAWYDLTKDERQLYNRVASSKGLPGIYLFVSRFIRAVRAGNGHGSLLSPDETLLD